MENKTKRFLSLLLALVMVIGLMPMGHAHAEEAETVLTLGEMVTSPDALVADSDYVICLAGTKNAMTNQRGAQDWGTHTLLTVAVSALNDSSIWTLETAEGGYKLHNENGYATVSRNTANLDAEGHIFELTYTADAGWAFKSLATNEYFNNLDDSGSIGGWSGDGTKFDIYTVVEKSWDEIDPYGKRNWVKVSVDTETLDGGAKEGEFEKAWDSTPNTHWHSDWKSATDKLDAEGETFTGVINFTKAYTINSFSFTPRQDDTASGQVTQATIAVKASEDAEWVVVAQSKSFASDATTKTICFAEQEVQYVKFVAEASNDGWVAVSEFDIALDENAHTPAEGAEIYCTDDIICVDCGAVIEKGADAHTPDEDDGDCTTEVRCARCPAVVIPAAADHTYDDEYDADCNVCGTTREVPEKPTEAVTYTVAVTAEGEGTVEGIPEAPVKEGTEVTVTATANEGYVFAGWYVGEELVSEDAVHSFTVTGDITLTAKFEEEDVPVATYAVTVNVEGEGCTVTGAPESTVDEGKTVTLTATAAEGYTFLGWFDGENLVSEDAVYSFTVTADITLTAKFEEEDVPVATYAVTVNVEGEGCTVTGAPEGTVDEGKTVTLTATAAEGYTFIGWFDGENLVSEDAEYTFEVTADVALVAKFEAEETPDPELPPVVVDFNATKANWTGTAESETIWDAKEGNFEYAWDGNTNTIWHTDWKGANKGVLTGENTISAEINFGEAYTINQFSFLPRQDGAAQSWPDGCCLLLQGSLFVKASEDAEWVCVADRVTFAHTEALKTFYFTEQPVQFVKLVCERASQMGLSDNNGPLGYIAVAEFYIEDDAASDLTITATTQGQGTVTGVPEAPVAIGTSVTLTAVPAEGYTFEGWYNSMDTKVSTDAAYTFPAATNITLSAKFVANTYTVTFDHGYNEQTSTKTVTHGNTVALPTVTRAGYAFGGWFDAEGNEFTAETVVTGDITVTAKWNEIVTYTVTFMLDENDSDPGTATVEEGKTLNDLPTPEREGYTFDGWFDAEGNEFTTETIVTGDITVTAKWTEAVVEPTNPEVTDPTVPDASEPDASEPDASEPDASEPDASEPDASEPEYTVPECDKDDNCTLSQFDDITVTEWYHDGIHFCVEEGIMNGMGEGKFAPTENTTRAQLVMMLYRLAGTPSVEGKTEPFTDVAENDWFYAPIVWAYNSVVVNGVSDTEFAPNASVTREQVATILHRYLGEPEGTGKLEEFPDVADVSEYAVAPLTWAVGEGLITGIAQADGTALLAPTGNATRAQIATILMRHLTK